MCEIKAEAKLGSFDITKPHHVRGDSKARTGEQQKVTDGTVESHAKP